MPLNLTLQVSGIEGWKNTFPDKLAKLPGGEDLIVKPKLIPGTAGATKEDQLIIQENSKAVKRNSLITTVSAIITAATLVISPAGGSDIDTITCRITGETGVSELVISAENPFAESLLKNCLDQSGNPIKIEMSITELNLAK